MLIVPISHPSRQRSAQAAHIGNINQPELVIGCQDNITHMERAEVYPQIMQPSNELRQPSEEFQLIQVGSLLQKLPEGFAIQGLVVDDGAVRHIYPIELDDTRAWDIQALQLGCVVGETLGGRIKGGFRKPALAPKQLEEGAVGQAQDLFPVAILLDDLRFGTPGLVLFPAEWLH